MKFTILTFLAFISILGVAKADSENCNYLNWTMPVTRNVTALGFGKLQARVIKCVCPNKATACKFTVEVRSPKSILGATKKSLKIKRQGARVRRLIGRAQYACKMHGYKYSNELTSNFGLISEFHCSL